MANVFLSYSRRSKAIATALAEDIEKLGHDVWFDQELSGGHRWWSRILARIRESDVFVLVLDPDSLESTACRREYGYAADLGKPIVPALVAEGVSMNLLPSALLAIQFVDYREQDRAAALQLANALSVLPPTEPLPDPLPPEPETPMSYLSNLTDLVDAPAELSFEQQVRLVFDLKRGLRDPATAGDSQTLLSRLRRRDELRATVAEDIDETLERLRASGSGDSEPTQPAVADTTPSNRGPTGAPAEVEVTQPTTPPEVGNVVLRVGVRRRLWTTLVVALALLSVGVAAYRLAAPNDVIVLPDVRGMWEGEARRVLESACRPVPCFDVTVRRQHDAVVSESTAIATQPEQTASRRSAVTLVVSSGPERVSVPAVRGENIFAGAARVNASGLHVASSAVLESSSDVAVDLLVGTRPGEGDLVPRGSEVQLVVSSGPLTDLCTPWPDCVFRYPDSLMPLPDPRLVFKWPEPDDPIDHFIPFLDLPPDLVYFEDGDVLMQLEPLNIPRLNILPPQ